MNVHTVKSVLFFKIKSFQVELSGSLRLSTGGLTGGPVADPRQRGERCGAFDLPRGLPNGKTRVGVKGSSGQAQPLHKESKRTFRVMQILVNLSDYTSKAAFVLKENGF